WCPLAATLLTFSGTRNRDRASRPAPTACRHPIPDRYSWCPAPAPATSKGPSSRTNPPPWAGTATRLRRRDRPPSRGRKSSNIRRRCPSPAPRPRGRRRPPRAAARPCDWWVSIRSCVGTPRFEVAGEKIRVMALDVRVHAHAEIHPAAQQIAVVVGAVVRVAETRIGFVVTTAGAQIANAAGLAMRAFALHGLVDEGAQACAVDAGGHIAEGGQIGAREAMTQIELAIAIHRQQPDSRSAGQGLAPPLVQVGHQLV